MSAAWHDLASAPDRDLVTVMGAMRMMGSRGLMAVAAAGVVALSAGLGAAAPAAESVSRGIGGPAVSGAQLWLSQYNGPAKGNGATAVAGYRPAGVGHDRAGVRLRSRDLYARGRRGEAASWHDG